MVIFVGGGAAVTTSSRHWDCLDAEEPLDSGIGPVGVSSVVDTSLRLGATD